MSTVVCQGLQSRLESQMVETRTLRLKLASQPKPSNPDLGGWSFLQSLSNSNFSQIPKQSLDKETHYVHPLNKQSSSILSYKSLELCTENLGSETGTDMTEISYFSLSSMDLESRERESPAREQQQPRLNQRLESKKINSRNFPPPLTTINGSNSLQVRPHREGGRLVIEAVEAPPTHNFLQAERSQGRLRLSLWKDRFATEENEESDIEEIGNEGHYGEKQNDKEEECEEQGEGEETEVYGWEDMDGYCSDVGVEMGMEKFQRPSRCKEGGLCNWEPLWVATS